VGDRQFRVKIPGHIRFAPAAALAVLLACGGQASAQKSKKPVPKKQAAAAKAKEGARAAQPSPAEELARWRAALVESAEEVKTSTRELIALRERQLASAEQRHEQLRQLHAEGLVAKVKLDESEESLAETRASVDVLRRQIDDSDRVIAEVAAAEEAEKLAKAEAEKLAKLQRAQSARLLRPTLYGTSALILRHTGSAHWTAANIGSVQSFFYSTFGRPLPVSAHGQTATHTRLGFDHSRGVDVALHPDSAEGRALIGYLQANGISFIAFRGAVAGSSTGAHIHIGPPSSRIG
jgi:hypothetical protein